MAKPIEFLSGNKFLKILTRIVLPGVIASFCVYYILTEFRWSEIWLILQRANLATFFLGSLVATVLFWLLRAARWAFLLRGEKLDLSFFKLYLYTATIVGFANFTPFQAGEALKVELFRKYGGERLSGYSFLVFEKFLDLLCLGALSLGGVSILLDFDQARNAKLLLAGLAAALAVFSAIYAIKSRRAKIALIRGVSVPDLPTSLVAFLLTLAGWATLIFGWRFILQSIGVELSAAETATIVSLTSLIGILSLVPGAVGVSEVSVAALLAHFGYENAQAQAGAVAIGVYSLVILILAAIHLVILKSSNFIKSRNAAREAEIN